jgi:acyl-coenzyme A synthetase/AMP-(fatty) acid ligase
MDKPFFIDTNIITYNQLISELNGDTTLANLSEIEKVVIKIVKNLVSNKILNYNDFISNIKQTNATIELNTSGTTGEPKVISHTFNGMIGNIKVSNDRLEDVWGFTYNPTKMAGYQVLFQSILNGNTLVNLFKCDYSEISDRIEKYHITHISATPTFYKLLVSDGIIYPNVKQISLGGEGSNIELQSKIKINFPNAKLKNIYASTEVSSLFASTGDLFKIPNKYKELVQLNSGKLMIHKSLVGKSKSIDFNNDWYDTGDLVEMIDDGSFKIIGREGSLINVGGYQINLSQIESKISELNFIKLCKVYSKSNSLLGNIIMCDLVLLNNISIFEIKNSIRGVVHDYEVPSKINIVDEIIINENGKISRK